MRKIHPVVLTMTVAAALTTSSCFAAAAFADEVLGDMADGAIVQESVSDNENELIILQSLIPESEINGVPEADRALVEDEPANDAVQPDVADPCETTTADAGREEGTITQSEVKIGDEQGDGCATVEDEGDSVDAGDGAGQQPPISSQEPVEQGQTEIGTAKIDTPETETPATADAAGLGIAGETDSAACGENPDLVPVDAADSDEVVAIESPVPSSGVVVSNGSASLAAAGPVVTGWQQEGGTTFYYGTDGKKMTGQQTIDGVTYYFDPAHDGAMATGLVTVTEQDEQGVSTAKTYYYGTDGKLVTGEVELDERWYYFDPIQNGLRAENAFVLLNGAYLANGPKTVFYNADGSMAYGEQEVEGSWYYLAPGSGARAEAQFVYLDGAYLAAGPKTVYYGDEGKMVYGEQEVAGAWYYLKADSGARAENEFVYLSGDYLVNGPKTVYYGDEGKMVYGEQEVAGAWYYLEPGSGARAHDQYVLLSGAYLANGPKMVYYGSDGKMLYGEHIIDGYRRWFDPLSGATDKIGYQNPIGRFQVSANSVLLPWYAYGTGFDYVTPSRIGLDATREDCIEAFVNRAYEYLGTPYRWDYALAPGVGVDCSGLVMQCLYAAGMNLGDYNPYKHVTDPWHSHDANNMAADPGFTHVDLADRQRGDLLFYPGHVAIYLGNDQVINAYPPQVQVQSMWTWGTPTTVARPFV